MMVWCLIWNDCLPLKPLAKYTKCIKFSFVLQPGGSAYESGGLKVGHKILEVNGKPLVGLEHITAAKTVAEAFKNNSEDDMELLVTDSDAVLKQE